MLNNSESSFCLGFAPSSIDETIGAYLEDFSDMDLVMASLEIKRKSPFIESTFDRISFFSRIPGQVRARRVKHEHKINWSLELKECFPLIYKWLPVFAAGSWDWHNIRPSLVKSLVKRLCGECSADWSPPVIAALFDSAMCDSCERRIGPAIYFIENMDSWPQEQWDAWLWKVATTYQGSRMAGRLEAYSYNPFGPVDIAKPKVGNYNGDFSEGNWTWAVESLFKGNRVPYEMFRYQLTYQFLAFWFLRNMPDVVERAGATEEDVLKFCQLIEAECGVDLLPIWKTPNIFEDFKTLRGKAQVHYSKMGTATWDSKELRQSPKAWFRLRREVGNLRDLE